MPADAPAAPAATPPITPPVTPAPATPPADDMDSTFRLLFEAAESEKTPPTPEPAPGGGGKSLMQAIDTPAADAPPAPDDPKAAEKAKAEKEAAEKAAKEKDAPPPVKVKKRKSEPAPTPAPAPAPTPEPPAAAPAADKPKTEDEKFEAGLLEEEKEQLDLARYAEQKDPSKYKGYAAKVTKFLKEHAAYLSAHPKATEPGSDEAEEYKNWLGKNNPALTPREAHKLVATRAAEEATAATAKETDAKLTELYDEGFRRDKIPEIKKEADQFLATVAREALPADITKLVTEQGVEKARQQFPMEFRIAGQVLHEITSDVEEFRRITTVNPKTGHSVTPWDKANPQHSRIIDFVNEQCNNFKNGTDSETQEQRDYRISLLTQNGKRFLTKEEFFALRPEQRNPYWTFNPTQIVTIYRHWAKREVDARLAREYKQREEDGYTRKVTAAPPATPPAPEPPGSPPAPRPSPIPAGGGPVDLKPERGLSLLMGE